jgi:hypothetical protein
LNDTAIDWAQPWLAPYRAQGESAARQTQAVSVAAALQGVAESDAPRFVPHDHMPPDAAYEAHIFRTGEVPTRNNLHDFFNGLVWLHCPAAKRRLNQLQAAEIARAGIGATRGPLRDALTLFDENGAVLDAPPALWDALIARDWHRLFIVERALWRDATLLVFGHALLEKLTVPRKAVTAHVLLTSSVPSWRGDGAGTPNTVLANLLDPTWLATKPFVPLPVLGIPGWWPGNENFSFYDDPDVFRPRRASQELITTRPLRHRDA